MTNYVSPLQRQVEQYLNLINQGVSQEQALATVGTTFAQLSAAGINLETPAQTQATVAAADTQLAVYRAQVENATRTGQPPPPAPPGYSLPGQTTTNTFFTPEQQAAAAADPLGFNLNRTPDALPATPADNRALLTTGITPVPLPAEPADNRRFLTDGVNATAPPVSQADFTSNLLRPGPGAITRAAEPLPTGGGVLTPQELQSGVVARTFQANASYQEVQFNNEERRRILEDYQRRGLSSAEAFEDPRYVALTQDANRLIAQTNAGTTVVPVQGYDNSRELRTEYPVISAPTTLTRSITNVSDSTGNNVPAQGGGSGPANTQAPVVNTSGYADVQDETAAPRPFNNPAPIPGNFSAAFDVETQSWGVYDNSTGRFTQTGLNQSEAISDSQTLTQTGIFTPPPPPVNQTPVNGTFSSTYDPETGRYGVWDNTTGRLVNSGLTESQAQSLAATYTNDGYTPPPPQANEVLTGAAATQASGEQQQATLALARQQQSIREQRGQQNQGDWRVKLRLAPSANYLYKSNDPGILWPLIETDGVIFPYTPRIDTSYRADYETVNLVHSNYRGYFYKSSYVDFVQINGTFTAQDTQEAEYLLAVITFFKSITKMFYGQDAQRGSPPPLVYLTGLGEYQFSEHPCVITQFNYNLPDNVDYIRARQAVVNATNLIAKRNRNSTPSNPISSAIQRLQTLGKKIKPGAVNSPPPPPTLGINNPTYVPTKLEISLQLLPMQSRQQVSEQFSLNNFANGNLIKGGFW